MLYYESLRIKSTLQIKVKNLENSNFEIEEKLRTDEENQLALHRIKGNFLSEIQFELDKIVENINHQPNHFFNRAKANFEIALCAFYNMIEFTTMEHINILNQYHHQYHEEEQHQYHDYNHDILEHHKQLQTYNKVMDLGIFIEKIWMMMMSIEESMMEESKMKIQKEMYISRNLPKKIEGNWMKFYQIIHNLIKFKANSSLLSFKSIFSWISDTRQMHLNQHLEPSLIIKKLSENSKNKIYNGRDELETNYTALLNKGETLITDSDIEFDIEEKKSKILEIESLGSYKRIRNILDLAERDYAMEMSQFESKVVTHSFVNASPVAVTTSVKDYNTLHIESYLKVEIMFEQLKNDFAPIKHDLSSSNTNDISTIYYAVANKICKSLGAVTNLHQISKNLSVMVILLKIKHLANVVKSPSSSMPFTEFDTAAVAVPSPMHSKKLKAMIVDDIKMNQNILKEYLQKLDVVDVADIASNGLQAVQFFQQRPPGFYDFIFMDIDMPIMDGKEASSKIREMEAHTGKHSTLVIITGNCSHEQFNEYLDKNGTIRADYVFSKPFTFMNCKNLIKEHSNDLKIRKAKQE